MTEPMTVEEFDALALWGGGKWVSIRAALIDRERLLVENAKLEAIFITPLEGAMTLEGCLVTSGTKRGWWDTMGISGLAVVGDKLVETGRWLRHPDGVNNRQFYRPIPKGDSSA